VAGATQVVNSYEHDEYGYGAQGEEMANRVAQNEKRMRKLDLACGLVPPPALFGADLETSDISIVCFGSTKGPVRTAADWLEAAGISVSILQVVTLWPFPVNEVTDFIDRSKRTMIIEGNLTGQLEGLIRQKCLRPLDWRINRYDGRPFAPEDIFATVREVVSGARA
jgi:2-oxoglutarate ferredoxin oxidoreductase subunit alpha